MTDIPSIKEYEFLSIRLDEQDKAAAVNFYASDGWTVHTAQLVTFSDAFAWEILLERDVVPAQGG
jgi:hypothetical protein